MCKTWQSLWSTTSSVSMIRKQQIYRVHRTLGGQCHAQKSTHTSPCQVLEPWLHKWSALETNSADWELTSSLRMPLLWREPWRCKCPRHQANLMPTWQRQYEASMPLIVVQAHEMDILNHLHKSYCSVMCTCLEAQKCAKCDQAILFDIFVDTRNRILLGVVMRIKP